MSGDSTYVYRQSWDHERARLAGLSAQFDPATTRHLARIGVEAGWRCWEVGAGEGSIARWLAEKVGDQGDLLVTDLDTRFLDDLAGPHVQVRQHDVAQDEIPHGEYHLVHARAVLEHVSQRERTLRRLVASLRPGGVLFVEDTAFGGILLAATTPMFSPAAAGGALSRVIHAVAEGFRAAGADPEYGLVLPERLLDAGLRDVHAELSTVLVRGGSENAQYYRLTFATLAERLVEQGLLDPVEAASIDALLSDEDTHWPSVSMMSAWGTRA